MINFLKSWLRFWLFYNRKIFLHHLFYSFQICIVNWVISTLYYVKNNDIAPLILKIIYQIVFTIFIL